jgi:hypothetical protein
MQAQNVSTDDEEHKTPLGSEPWLCQPSPTRDPRPVVAPFQLPPVERIARVGSLQPLTSLVG